MSQPRVAPRVKHEAKVTLLSIDIRTANQARRWLKRNANDPKKGTVAQAIGLAFPKRES